MTTTSPDAAALAERMRRQITPSIRRAVRNGADLDEERARLATALGGGS